MKPMSLCLTADGCLFYHQISDPAITMDETGRRLKVAPSTLYRQLSTIQRGPLASTGNPGAAVTPGVIAASL